MRDETKVGKTWQKPELLVLTRGKPEEAVLASCKYTSPSSGPDSENSMCSEICAFWFSSPVAS